jgi:hypothetical protein
MVAALGICSAVVGLILVMPVLVPYLVVLGVRPARLPALPISAAWPMLAVIERRLAP